MKTTKLSTKRFPSTYTALCTQLMPRPIHDAVSYENAVEMIDALAGRELNSDQTDYLEILSRMVEDYDNAHHALPPVHGADALAYLLKENDLTGDDLAVMLRIDRSAAYKILKGTRSLTTTHVANLAQRFKVSADVFISP